MVGDTEERDVFGEAVEIGGEVGVGERFYVSVGWWGGGLLWSLIARDDGEGEEKYEPGFFHAGIIRLGPPREEEDNAEAQRCAEFRGEMEMGAVAQMIVGRRVARSFR
jgi:hypothetical protein